MLTPIPIAGFEGNGQRDDEAGPETEAQETHHEHNHARRCAAS
jgi:hypothetical protein